MKAVSRQGPHEGGGCDVPSPDPVVTQRQATDTDTVARNNPVTVLVHVAAHHVEVARITRRAPTARGELKEATVALDGGCVWTSTVSEVSRGDHQRVR